VSKHPLDFCWSHLLQISQQMNSLHLLFQTVKAVRRVCRHIGRSTIIYYLKNSCRSRIYPS
jgi:hypothetical protein